MAQIIKLRRSSTAGKVPTTSDLNLGELAINTNDGRIFFEKNDGSAAIKHVITSDSQTTGSIEITGNISGSATSTGSFGRLRVAGTSLFSGDITAERIYQGNGTAALPSHTFDNDSDTGMYRKTTNQLGFSTAGTLAVHLDASQNATFAGDATIDGGDITLVNTTPTIVAEQSSGAIRAKIKFPTSSGDGDITFETTTNGAGAITEQMRITHAGNVGIGTTSPATALQVSGSLNISQQTIPSTVTTALDFTDSNNFKVTLGTNTTLSSSNEASAIGSTGVVVLVQDATGGRTVALPATWKTPKGQSISFDTSANDINIISYYVIDASTVAVNYIGDFS
jgi:hypothetical protein